MAPYFSGLIDSVKAYAGTTNRRPNSSSKEQPQDGGLERRPEFTDLYESPRRPCTYMARAASGTNIKGPCPVISNNYYVAWIEDMCFTLRRVDIPDSMTKLRKLSAQDLKNLRDIVRWEYHLDKKTRKPQGEQWWRGSDEEVLAVNEKLTSKHLEILKAWLWECQTSATLKLDRIAQAEQEKDDRRRMAECEFDDGCDESQTCCDFDFEKIDHQDVLAGQCINFPEGRKNITESLLSTLLFWKRETS